MKTKNHLYFDQTFVDLFLKFIQHFQFVLNEISKNKKPEIDLDSFKNQ
jgi:hypothetical protein